MGEGFNFSTALLRLVIVFFCYRHFNEYEMVSQCGFDVHFNFACFQCFEMDSMVKKKKKKRKETHDSFHTSK